MLGDTRFGPTSECLPNISRSGPTSGRLPNVSLPVQTSPHDTFLHIVDRHSSPFGPTSECLPKIPEHLPKSGPTSFLVSFPCSISLFVPSPYPFLICVFPLFIYFPLTPHWVYMLGQLPNRLNRTWPIFRWKLAGDPKSIYCKVMIT